MTRTYTFVFDPDAEGGFVVPCPALPGLVTHGVTLEEARNMARDAWKASSRPSLRTARRYRRAMRRR